MQALIAQVDLARIDEPAHEAKPGVAKEAPRLPAALVADVRAQVARADREITDGYERQAVITAAALPAAARRARRRVRRPAEGQPREEPFALLPDVGAREQREAARRQGRGAALVRARRSRRAKALPPGCSGARATSSTLVELAPHDEAAIEAATTQLWSEAAAQPDAFYERSARSLQKVGARLQAWNKGGAHRASMARLEAKLGSLCAAPSHTEAERATCRSLLGAPAKPTAA